MFNSKHENDLELFKQAQKVLSDPIIDKSCNIRLDCANITDVDYEVPKKIVSNTYPILEPKTVKAFRVKLASLGVDLNKVDVGVTHSVFEFLKEALLKISFNELRQHKRETKILLPKGQFGYFYDIIKKSGAEPILADINKDSKLHLSSNFFYKIDKIHTNESFQKLFVNLLF